MGDKGGKKDKGQKQEATVRETGAKVKREGRKKPAEKLMTDRCAVIRLAGGKDPKNRTTELTAKAPMLLDVAWSVGRCTFTAATCRPRPARLSPRVE